MTAKMYMSSPSPRAVVQSAEKYLRDVPTRPPVSSICGDQPRRRQAQSGTEMLLQTPHTGTQRAPGGPLSFPLGFVLPLISS